MPRIAWVDEDAATGRIAELYAHERAQVGLVPDISKTFSGRPEALEGLYALGAVHFGPDAALTRAQREMIATHVSAVLDCHYWLVCHGFFLRSQGAAYHQAARALATGAIEEAGLSAADRALLDYAEKLTRTPASISDSDVEALRAHGFDDAQIWEATFTAAAFNLFTRMADAFGIQPPPQMAAALGLAPDGRASSEPA